MTIKKAIEYILKACVENDMVRRATMFTKVVKELNRLEPVKTNMSRISNILLQEMEHLQTVRVLFCIKDSKELKRGWIPTIKWKIGQIRSIMISGRNQAVLLGDEESVQTIDKALREIDRHGKKPADDPPEYESIDGARAEWANISLNIREEMNSLHRKPAPQISPKGQFQISQLNEREMY